MKKRIVRVPISKARAIDMILETTRTISYRRARLGKKEYDRRQRNSTARTAGTRRAQTFVLKRLDEVLAVRKERNEGRGS